MSIRHPDVVLFDIGGVLTRLDFEALAHVLRPEVDARVWTQWMLASRAATDFERGAASPEVFGAAVVAEVGAPGATVAAALAAFDSWLVGPLPGALELLDETRGAGAAVGCLSNCNVVHAPRLMEMGLVSRFEPALFSHELGLAKPDPAMYSAATRPAPRSPARRRGQYVLEQFGCDAHRGDVVSHRCAASTKKPTNFEGAWTARQS